MYHIRIKPLREVSNQEENNEQPLRALQGPAKERWESSCNLKLGNSYFPNVNKYLTDQVLHLWQIFKPWQSTFLEVGLKMYAKSRKMVNGGSWGGNKEVKGAIQCSCGYVYFSYENVAENVQEDRQVFKKHLGSWQKKNWEGREIPAPARQGHCGVQWLSTWGCPQVRLPNQAFYSDFSAVPAACRSSGARGQAHTKTAVTLPDP